MRHIIRNTSESVIIYADYERTRVELQDLHWSRSSIDRRYYISSTLGVIDSALMGSFVTNFCIFALPFGIDIPSVPRLRWRTVSFDVDGEKGKLKSVISSACLHNVILNFFVVFLYRD